MFYFVVLGIIGYLPPYLVAARKLYVNFDLEKPAARGRPSDISNRGWAAFVALFWPLILLVSVVHVIAFRETPRQRRDREKREAEVQRKRYREVAESFGLPAPEFDVRPDIIEHR